MNNTLILIAFCILTSAHWLTAQNDTVLFAQQSEDTTTNTELTAADASSSAEKMLRRTNYLYNANRFDSLSILAERASVIFEQQQDWANYVEAQLMLSTDLYLKNDLVTAKALSTEVLKISKEKLGEKHFATARAYMQEGIMALADLKDKAALEYFSVAHRILAEAPGQTTTIAKLYSLIAFIHYNFNDDPTKALSYCETALTILKNKLDSSDAELGNIYAEIGLLYADLEKNAEALNIFEKALKVYYRNYSDNLMGVATVNYNIGLLKAEEEKYEEAIESYEKALELVLLTSGGDNQLAVNINSKIGQLYMSQLKDRAKAMPYLKSAITTSKKINSIADENIEYRYRILGKYYIN